MAAPADPNDRPVPLIACNPEGISPELRKLPHWVAFDYTAPKKLGGKYGKVPIEPHTGRKASTTNFATWGTCAQALACAKQSNLGGIGFVFTGSGYVGIDLDNCRDPETGFIEPWAQEIIDDCATYTEISPSGKGVHCILRGKLPGPGRRKGNIEIYDTGRYFTMTGVLVEGTPEAIADGQPAIDRVLAGLNRGDAFLLEPVEVVRPVAQPAPAGTDIEDWKKEDLFGRLWSGDQTGYPSQSEADLRLVSLIRSRVGNDPARIDELFRKSGLYRPKWDERRGAQTYGERTIQVVVERAPTRIEFVEEDEPAPKPEAPKPIVPIVVPRQSPVESEDKRVARTLTDTGNAERLVAKYGANLRYVPEWKQWLIWKGGRWVIDLAGAVMEASKLVARGLYAEGAAIADSTLAEEIQKHAKNSEKAERRKAMVELARYEKHIAVLVSQLDRHTDLFNFRNGTVNLRTFAFKPHDRTDYLTKRCPAEYNADAACPGWERFLERILPDDEVRAYLQRFIGYSLTGDVSEQAMLLGIGHGDNGKSTFANVIQFVFSREYAIQIPPELLIAKEHRNHPTEIADLFGVRLAFGIETAKSQQFDEALLKQLTGGDPLRARRMREDFWQFDPTHKLFLLTNHMPKIVGREHAIWRRLHRVNFDVRIRKEEKDKHLVEKLKREREGVLAWCVQGARMWREQGLNPPEGVQLEAPNTAAAVTPAEEFASLFILARPGHRTSARDLFEAYRNWSTTVDAPVVSQQEFGSLLGARGHGSKKTGGVMVYVDTELVGDNKGQEGPPPGLTALVSSSRESNDEGGPFCPSSSLNGLLDVQEAIPDEPTEPAELAQSPSDEPWEH